ncbi:MAG: hypothetical protein H8E21_05480 [Gammaproteobacteria bacterium]|nr:hypothetical protein [Gammaproteobacteria bacterium]
MEYREKTYLSFGVMTLIVGGIALCGLLLYGWKSGQELPFWPALAVSIVNILGALRLVKERKNQTHKKPNASANVSESVKQK